MNNSMRIFKAVSLDVYKQLVTSSLNSKSNPDSVMYDKLPVQVNSELQEGDGFRLKREQSEPLVQGTQLSDSAMKVLDYIPESQKSKSRRLLHILTNSGKFSWNGMGEIVISGKVVPNSNIVDLISAATSSSKFRKMTIPRIQELIQFLLACNVPKYFLGSPMLQKMERSTHENKLPTHSDIARGNSKQSVAWIDYEQSPNSY
jgi:hypothetical protein